ncbi:MAG: aldehyde dehydrogenase family protein [Planctomycetia bacterium]|nr:aldehyde dehydrogenase family protein [Planctomycetia bacterium]
MFQEVLSRLGLRDTQSGVCAGDWVAKPGGGEIVSTNPATGDVLGRVRAAARGDYDRVVASAHETFLKWRLVPAPERGQVIRSLGDALRRKKQDLGLLVTLETGKIRSEGEGEVQEMIDMCDFAVGLSRQLYGLTIASERPSHRMFEQWHPLGPVGVVTAFNFPVAVWAWNAAVAAVGGDTVVWKPSARTPLSAVAVEHIVQKVFADAGHPGVFSLCVGGKDVAQWMADDPRLPLFSATGSCAMGRALSPRVAARLGRTLLELGGNNAAIVTETAELDLAVRAIVFGAVGTAGQRCTSLRRLFVHESIADALLDRLVRAYRSVPLGNPWEDGVLLGPLISREAVEAMQTALGELVAQGGQVVYGGAPVNRPGHFALPAIALARADMPIVARETFAPILYVIRYKSLDEAIAWHNQVEQGLSSAIFTDSLRQAEVFLSPAGSDCGIANVNIGTSGAEIGGAFGGEKATGGGREAGSDAWKAYMRRQTCTVNYGRELPLSQGVRFDVSS